MLIVTDYAYCSLIMPSAYAHWLYLMLMLTAYALYLMHPAMLNGSCLCYLLMLTVYTNGLFLLHIVTAYACCLCPMTIPIACTYAL